MRWLNLEAVKSNFSNYIETAIDQQHYTLIHYNIRNMTEVVGRMRK